MKKVTLAIVIAIVAGIAFGSLTATGFWTKLSDDTSFSTQALTAAERGGLFGTVHYILKDKDGNIKYETSGKNRIVDTGEDIIQRTFKTNLASTELVNTVCVGIGTTAEVENGAGSTLVTAPGAGSLTDICKVDATVTIVNATGAIAQSVEVDATFLGATDFAAGAIIAESVLANTDPGGATLPAAANTFARKIFPGITVASGDSLTVKWTITLTE